MTSSIKPAGIGLFSVCTAGILVLSPTGVAYAQSEQSFVQSYQNLSNIKSKHIPLVYRAEKNTSRAGKAVLREARNMALDQQKIIKGSCWNYLNAVFNKARVSRKKLFEAKKDGGRYFNLNNLQAGDWIYHTNLSYHNIEHSGMFVGWVDKRRSKALMLSYKGQDKKEPARYKVYDISRTYNVMRPEFKTTDHFLYTDTNSSPVISNKKILSEFYSNSDKMAQSRVVAEDDKQAKLPQFATNSANPIDIIPLKSSSLKFTVSAKSAIPIESHLEQFVPIEEDNVTVKAKTKVRPQPQYNSSNKAIPDLSVQGTTPAFGGNVKIDYKANREDNPSDFINKYAYSDGIDYHDVPLLFYSEQYSTEAVKKVLQQARKMTLENKSFTLKDPHYYMQSVFRNAHVQYDNIFTTKEDRERPFSPDRVQAGDWIYYSAGNRDKAKTGIFVSWVDETENEGLVLSYDSKARKQKARYQVRRIGHVYDVKRPEIGDLDLSTQVR